MGGGALPNSQRLSVVAAQELNFGTFQGNKICKKWWAAVQWRFQHKKSFTVISVIVIWKIGLYHYYQFGRENSLNNGDVKLAPHGFCSSFILLDLDLTSRMSISPTRAVDSLLAQVAVLLFLERENPAWINLTVLCYVLLHMMGGCPYQVLTTMNYHYRLPVLPTESCRTFVCSMLVAPITDSIASNWWFCLTIVLRTVGCDISWGCSLMINFDGTWSSTPLSELFDFQRVAKRSCHWKAPTRKSNDAGFCRMFQLYSFLWESVEAPQKVVVPSDKKNSEDGILACFTSRDHMHGIWGAANY